MLRRQSDGCPAVGMYLVGQRAQKHRLVAVRLVEVALAELLDDHLLLGGELLGGDLQPFHAVAFEPECRFEIVLRERDVEVRVVVVREGVVVARGHLHRQVEVRHFARAAEHEVLEQVGESRACGVFVARPDLVEDVHRGELRGPVAVHRHGQAVGECRSFVCDHTAKIVQGACNVKFISAAVVGDPSSPTVPSGGGSSCGVSGEMSGRGSRASGPPGEPVFGP